MYKIYLYIYLILHVFNITCICTNAKFYNCCNILLATFLKCPYTLEGGLSKIKLHIALRANCIF